MGMRCRLRAMHSSSFPDRLPRVLAAIPLLALAASCTSNPTVNTGEDPNWGGGAASGGTSGSSGGGAAGEGFGVSGNGGSAAASGSGSAASSGSGASGGASDVCTAIEESTQNQVLPADIILAIDQSGSMDTETDWVKTDLNAFAQQITTSGIDVRVVVIAGAPGSENGFCVPEPLGSGNCPDDDTAILRHVKQHVDSHDALEQILDEYDNYKDFLRVGAKKHLIVISDDDSDMGSDEFDKELKKLEPPMFEGYLFHGIYSYEDDPGKGKCNDNPVPCCGVSADEGKVYKELVQLTQGVSGDLCAQNFSPVWDAVSSEIIASAPLQCEWEIPPPPNNQELDPTQVNVKYVAGGQEEQLGYVADAGDCGDVERGWYYDDVANPNKVLACPDLCAEIQGQTDASISILFGCGREDAVPK
jgi:hypothetical protein